MKLHTIIQDLGSGYGGGLDNYMNPIADYHTHGNSAFGPSATDVISLASKPTGYASNLTVAYSRANDGTTYAMLIADTAKATAFFRANQDNRIGTNWNPESAIGIKFRQVRDYFSSVGMSLKELMNVQLPRPWKIQE